MQRNYGDVVSFRSGPVRFYQLTHPEHVQEVLLKKESMRIYPPVYFFSREAAAPVEVAGYNLRPGSQVHILPYLLHHDPRWFPKPERFDPARFAAHREEQLPQCAYLPFGAGPRACVGRSFAMIEGVLILASILERYNLSLAPGQGEPEAATQISLHPKGGVRLRATERRPALAATHRESALPTR